MYIIAILFLSIPNRLCVSPALSIVITVSATSSPLIFSTITFILGALVGTYRKKRKEASTTVSVARSEIDAAAFGENETATGMELERIHEYEDIVVLNETLNESRDIDTFTSNVAYGCSNS